MSKNLSNIPRQMSMSETQEQTFTNGINKGRKLERDRIIGLLEAMPRVAHDGLVNARHFIALIKGENK